MFNDDEKYNGHIPHIKYLPTDAIEHSGMAGEVHHVSDNVARNMDFSEPLETTAFRYNNNNNEHDPSVQLSNGHHRLAAAKQMGVPYLPVTVHARNAKGHKLNALKALSDEIEGRVHKEDGGGITAYHGSPHDFDKFDTSKIGTGEGNQSYGHGLYFAEHEPVAKGYRDQLSKGQGQFKIVHAKTGEEIHPDTPGYDRVHGFYRDDFFDQTYSDMRSQKENYISGLDDTDPSERAEKELLQNTKAVPVGHMYEVHIDAHPDHFLDWDKPLSKQSKHVRDAFDFHKDLIHSNPYLETFFNNVSDGQSTGAQIYKELSDKNAVGLGEKGASDFLHSMGVHGIKYFDAGSRNAVNNYGGAGTRNYVVFDHNRVNVKRKYEQGGSVRRPYKKGGKVEGAIWHERDAFANGGDPSLQNYIDNLPTAEQNIDTIKNMGKAFVSGAMSPLTLLSSSANKDEPDYSKQELNPASAVSNSNENAAPSEPRYMAPDQSGNMWTRKQIEDYYSQKQANFYGDEQNPAPTRAPMRGKLERQRNVNQPVVLPEQKSWDFPQTYKDIMNPEPQMDWTKGMTPREQAPSEPLQVGVQKSVPRLSIREQFNNAFADAAKKGLKEFTWTNPKTGKSDIYPVKYEKSGGRTLNSQIVQQALSKSRVSLPTSGIPLTGNATGRRR